MSLTEDELGSLRSDVRQLRLSLVARQLSYDQQASLKRQQRLASAESSSSPSSSLQRRGGMRSAAAVSSPMTKRAQYTSAAATGSDPISITPRRSMSSVSDNEHSHRQFDLRTRSDSSDDSDPVEMTTNADGPPPYKLPDNVMNSTPAAVKNARNVMMSSAVVPPPEPQPDLISFDDDAVVHVTSPPRAMLPTGRHTQPQQHSVQMQHQVPQQVQQQPAQQLQGFEDNFAELQLEPPGLISLDLRVDDMPPPPLPVAAERAQSHNPSAHAQQQQQLNHIAAAKHTRNRVSEQLLNNSSPTVTSALAGNGARSSSSDRVVKQPVENSSDPFAPVVHLQRRKLAEKSRQRQPSDNAPSPQQQHQVQQKQVKVPQQHDVKAALVASSLATARLATTTTNAATSLDVRMPQPTQSPRSPMQRRVTRSAMTSEAQQHKKTANMTQAPRSRLHQTTPDRPIEVDDD